MGSCLEDDDAIAKAVLGFLGFLLKWVVFRESLRDKNVGSERDREKCVSPIK